MLYYWGEPERAPLSELVERVCIAVCVRTYVRRVVPSNFCAITGKFATDGENKTDAGQLSDTKLWLPDEENKTDVGQLSDTKIWLPDGENKTERHEAMLA